MGIHHESTHGRVFRGIDAKNHLEMHKRDSHGNKIKLNIPKHMLAAARPADAAQVNAPAPNNHAHKVALRPADPGQLSFAAVQKEAVQTIDSVVYVTMSAEFTGSTAGYVTLTPTSTPSVTVDAQTAAPAATSVQQNSAPAASQSAADSSVASDNTAVASNTAVSASTIIVSPTSSSAPINNKSMFLNPPATAVAAATTSSAAFGAAALSGTSIAASAVGATVVGGTPISATRAAQIDQASTGMSGGAKAGLAIGIILAIALSAGLLFFCFRRRKNQENHEELIDEKHASSVFGGKNSRMSAASVNTTHTAATAPRLSLRPVTQFLPNLSDNRKSAGNALDAASAAMSEKPKSMWERRDKSSQNPFDDAAVLSEKQATNNPFDEPEGHAEDGRTSPSSFKSANSGSHSQKASWEGSEPATPKSTKFGTASAVAVAAAGSASTVPPMPKAATPNNVHRVQLDFKPSMEDELELISGQLVLSLIHI